MQCISCGATLVPGMDNCPRCGTPAAYSSSLPAQSQQANTHSASFYTNETQAGTQPAYSGTPPQGLPQVAAPAWQPNSPIQPQPPGRRGGLSRGMLITLIVLLLVILIGSGLIYYFTGPYPAQLHAQATATAQTLVNNHATSTAVVIHNTNATATAQVQATQTAQQNIYNQATNGNPSLTETLAQNGALRWEEYDSANSGGCIFAGGAYHVKELTSGYFQPCLAQSSNFNNFTLQMQMTILSGNDGGIVFRTSTTSGKFYLLQFGTDHSYQLYKYTNNSGSDSQTLLSGYSSIIKGANQANLITLIARGPQLTIFVNKQYLDTVSDSAYASGGIGFIADNRSSSTEVSYSNLQIWKL